MLPARPSPSRWRERGRCSWKCKRFASATTFSNPRRTPNGIDLNRLLLLTAVLTRRVHVPVHDKDVFVNVIGGLQISEPAADLASLWLSPAALRIAQSTPTWPSLVRSA